MIEVLRGASAIAVTLFHLNEAYPPLADVYHRLVKWGWLGVPVFFVISGYCVAAARSKSQLVPFWFRRLARIFPPYWGSIVVVLAVVALRVLTTGTNDVTPLPQHLTEWVYTVLALTTPASAVPGLNWAYWSLGYEIAFYILLGLLGVGLPGLWVGLFSLLACFLPGFPFDLWGLFGLGIASYHFTKREWQSGTLIALICLVSLFQRSSLPVSLIAVLTTLLILFPPALIGNLLFTPFFRVGEFSYSLYLTHVSIGCYLLPRYLPSALSREFWPSLLQDLFLLVACLAFARLFYHWIEKPSHEFARRGIVAPGPTREPLR